MLLSININQASISLSIKQQQKRRYRCPGTQSAFGRARVGFSQYMFYTPFFFAQNWSYLMITHPTKKSKIKLHVHVRILSLFELTHKWAMMLISKALRISFSEVLSSGLHGMMPALLTSMVTSPTSRRIFSARALIASRSVTSHLRRRQDKGGVVNNYILN